MACQGGEPRQPAPGQAHHARQQSSGKTPVEPHQRLNAYFRVKRDADAFAAYCRDRRFELDHEPDPVISSGDLIRSGAVAMGCLHDDLPHTTAASIG